jgi:hypothetical protein
MNGNLIADIHLVKLVNSTDAPPILVMRVNNQERLQHGGKKKKNLQPTASISAPASMVNSPVSASLTTDAVKPAAEDALPLV